MNSCRNTCKLPLIIYSVSTGTQRVLPIKRSRAVIVTFLGHVCPGGAKPTGALEGAGEPTRTHTGGRWSTGTIGRRYGGLTDCCNW